jgi:hypothetical protein
VKIPGLRNRANIFAGYQHTDDHNATTQSVLMPTAAERRGDFSQSVNAFGQPVRLVDPATGAPFGGNVIPQSRISPQAAALLRLYPSTNVDGPSTSLRASGANYETPVLAATRQDALQLRFMQTLDLKNQLTGNVSIQRTRTETGNVFGFVDTGAVSASTSRSPSTIASRSFCRCGCAISTRGWRTDVTPYFAYRENIAGNAGIGGVNQDPANWGPPALTFSSGIAGLSSAQYTSNHDRTHGFGGESIWSHGRHTITAGGDSADPSAGRRVAAECPRRLHLHWRGDRIGSRGLPARFASRERDRLRQRRQIPAGHERGRLRDRRHAAESHVYRQRGFAMGVRIALSPSGSAAS